MTTQFYVPTTHVHGDRLSLPKDEAQHALRSLRLRAGDEIVAVDGIGGWYRAVLEHAGRGEAVGHIVERRQDVGEPPYRLIVALGVTKHRARFETFLEKSVELGVSEIVPLLSARTEKDRIREQRSESILIAAMKQCGRSRVPLLHEPTPFEKMVSTAEGARFCCHESADHESSLLSRIDREDPRVTVLVGPEGGFTDEEVERVVESGFDLVSLGVRRLRAETAGIAVAAIVGAVYDAR